MIDKTSNYSLNRLIAGKTTDIFIYDENGSEDKVIQFIFDIEPDARRLKIQAKTFASNFRTHAAYSFDKLFGCRSHEVEDRLEKMYIYSFFKVYYSILFPEALSSDDMGGYCFIGHAKLYQLLQVKNLMHNKEGVTISTSFDLGSMTDRKIKFALLLQEFSFLKKYVGTQSATGSYPFYITDHETKFSKLVEDYYAKRAGGEPDTKMESEDFTEGKNLRPISVKNNFKDKIEITTVRNKECQSIRDWEELPLTNSFYRAGDKVLMFIETNGNFETKYNVSFFTTIANFIVLKYDKSSSKDIKRYYKSTIVTEKQNFLINSEVYSITGIKCSFNQASKFPTGSVGFPIGFDPNELIDALRDRPGITDDFISMFEFINEFINEWNINITNENQGSNKGK